MFRKAASKVLSPTSVKGFNTLIDQIMNKGGNADMSESLLTPTFNNKVPAYETKVIASPKVTQSMINQPELTTSTIVNENSHNLAVSSINPSSGHKIEESIVAWSLVGDNGLDLNRTIYTSGERKLRIENEWSFEGPNDQDLKTFYEEINRHFNSNIVKGMFSLETEKLKMAINEINDILQNHPETFMDVQDLILQWIFLRSFEARPLLTTLLVEFLIRILHKYSGADLFQQSEKNLMI